MPLGPDVVEWQALRDALRALAEDCAALDAFVLDRWGRLWCAAHAVDPSAQSEAIGLARRAVAFHRGSGTLDRSLPASNGRRAHARSFASAYLVLVMHDELARDLRGSIDRHLAQIERCTLALPRQDETEPSA